MEGWRIIATVLLAVAGVLLTLAVMAKVRDHTQSSGQVAIGGAVTFTILLILGVLMLTVLPAVVTWVLVAVVVAAVSVMLLAS
ncbi:hypothetical protein [Amycolatopsis sp. CA-230715]|uniref:hypothetical protein n=1 Tax=Amycolatopsis sp. CA-230715 TaxID=2745196 RepID=UPI001C018C18|nr:hypothetical protein [Amycolatopsis sp. CA-230715]QWF81360.1 hypothetical protein HUW46_04791 [Amycolatopsis sp. CA-230715]